MKISLYYHIWIPSNTDYWRLLIDEQLKTIYYSGLLNYSQVNCAIICPQDKQTIIYKYLLDSYNFLNIRQITSINSEYEGLTLKYLYQDSLLTEQEIHVMYFHTKGMRYYGNNDPRIKNINSWRHYLEFAVIDNWPKMIQSLNDNDVAGIDYLATPFPHFHGNFWWSKSSYIKTLKHPTKEFKSSFYKKDDSYNPTDYMKCEEWVCSANHKVFILNNSRQFLYNYDITDQLLSLKKSFGKENNQVLVIKKSLNYYSNNMEIKSDNKINSLAVIIPLYNGESTIERTIQSIYNSLDFFYQNQDIFPQIKSEIIIVNDLSTDNSLAVIQNCNHEKYVLKIINHTENRGQSAGRNTGVKNSVGEILFFCDQDDLFLPEHIYLCYKILNHDNEASSEGFKLCSNRFDSVVHLGIQTKKIDAVRTGVIINENIHPYWKKAIENSLPLNLCVRRYCHEFIEGFPEDSVYREIGGAEDCAYQRYLTAFFNLCNINLETVEFLRKPGNSLDLQLPKFQLPPGEYKGSLPHEKGKEHLFQRANQIENSKLTYLKSKLAHRENENSELPGLNQQDTKTISQIQKQEDKPAQNHSKNMIQFTTKNIEKLEKFLQKIKGETYPEPPSPLHTKITQDMLAHCLNKYNISAEANVLDIGCGQGVALELFTQKGFKSIGITLNSEDVRICRDKGYEVYEMDQSFLDFEDQSFDFIWCRHCIEHSIFPYFTLSEIYRVLKVNGYVYIEVPAPDTSCRHQDNPNHYSTLGKSLWVSLIKRTGFSILEVLDLNFTVPAGPDTYWVIIVQKAA